MGIGDHLPKSLWQNQSLTGDSGRVCGKGMEWAMEI